VEKRARGGRDGASLRETLLAASDKAKREFAKSAEGVGKLCECVMYELERSFDAWDIDALAALTATIVDYADFDAVDAGSVRETLVNAFERCVERVASMKNDFSGMVKQENDMILDLVWMINQLVKGLDAKRKAEWSPMVYHAVEMVLIEKLPPILRREALLCLKTLAMGCADTSMTLKNILCPKNTAGKRIRRGDSSSKLAALAELFLRCGDFDAQKQIAEILYRLVKAELLDLDLAASIFTHVSSQFKDLLQIQNTKQMFKSLRTLVRHFNTAQGSIASVQSFEAESLSLEGLKIKDKWVNFGSDMMTVHVCLDEEDESVVEPVDILYSNIRAFSMPESNAVHVGIREKPLGLAPDDPFSLTNDGWIQIKFQKHSGPALLEQVFRICKRSEVVELFLENNSDLMPTKKKSVGILDLDLTSETESMEASLPKPLKKPSVSNAKAKKQLKPKPAIRKRPKAATVLTESDTSTELHVAATKSLSRAPLKQTRQLPKRKAKQEGLNKLNEQLNEALEDLVEEDEASESLPDDDEVPPSSLDEKDPVVSSQETAEDNWTIDDIPALMKMIKAKHTSKKQREDLQRVVADLRRRSAAPSKSVFKTPAASIQAPKTNMKTKRAPIKAMDTFLASNRSRDRFWDSAKDHQKARSENLPTSKRASALNLDDIDKDDYYDDDDEDENMGELSPLSNFLNDSNTSPLLKSDKSKSKKKASKILTAKTPAVATNDMASFQQMMHSLAERNRRIALERITALINDFKQETESATRKLINHIERDLEAASAAAARRVAERRAQAIALRDRLSVLNTDYKSSLRVLCEDYSALKRAREEDVQQSVVALDEIERLRSSDADALLRRVDAKRRRVATECQSAHKSVHSNDGVKSMLLELARSM